MVAAATAAAAAADCAVDMTAGQAHPTTGLEARPVLPALFVTTWSLEERLSNDSLPFAFTQRGCRQGNIDLTHCKHWRLTPVGSQDEDQAIKRTLCDVDGRVCNSVPVGVSNLCSRPLGTLLSSARSVALLLDFPSASSASSDSLTSSSSSCCACSYPSSSSSSSSSSSPPPRPQLTVLS